MNEPHAWTDEDGRVHFIGVDSEIIFDNPARALLALDKWQKHMIFDMPDMDFMPQEAWEMFAEANKN